MSQTIIKSIENLGDGAQQSEQITSTREGNKNYLDVNVKNGTSQELIFIADYSDPQYIYLGNAEIGSSVSGAVWQIRRVEIIDDSATILFANSSKDFANTWVDRVSLTYG